MMSMADGIYRDVTDGLPADVAKEAKHRLASVQDDFVNTSLVISSLEMLRIAGKHQLAVSQQAGKPALAIPLRAIGGFGASLTLDGVEDID
jgi:hypothetical protein